MIAQIRLLILAGLLAVAASPVRASTLPLTVHDLTPSAETVRAGGTDWPAFFEGTVTWSLKSIQTQGGIANAPQCLESESVVKLTVKLVNTGLLGGGMGYEAQEGTWGAVSSCFGHYEDATCRWDAKGNDFGGGTFPASGSGVFLYLYSTHEAHLSFALQGGEGHFTFSSSCGTGGSGSSTHDPLWGAGTHDESLVKGSWSGDGADLSVTLRGTNRWEHGVIEGLWYTANWLGGFGPRQLVLAIEPGAAYATWRPEAGVLETDPGNTLALRARLRYSDGSDADLDAQSFTFSFAEVSHVPGTAINRPIGDAREDPDLRFDARANPAHTVAPDGQRLTATGGREATAVVTAYDWGAWGTVRVEATLPGGLVLTGVLDGTPGQNDVRLPRRTAQSRIADAWKQTHRADGLADDSDSDPDPSGDGQHPGDGLTLYEEYRGFYENGVHRSSDPTKKDLFVFDEIGGSVTKRGIARFAQGTGLVVHHQFQYTEYGADRRINPNHGSAPHTVDQHGIRLVRVNEDRGAAIAVPVVEGAPPGPPGSRKAVEIPRNVLPGGAMWRGGINVQAAEDYVASTIAHELGHGVGIWHHGETDAMDVLWRAVRASDGSFARDALGHILIEEGTPLYDASGDYARGPDGGLRFDAPPSGTIEVYSEAGQRVTPAAIQRSGELLIDEIGVPGGQHSGDENCFMRYDNALAYRASFLSSARYFGIREAHGRGLCSRRVGTGVNDASRLPQSRYGDATRGACQHQILVSDRYLK